MQLGVKKMESNGPWFCEETLQKEKLIPGTHTLEEHKDKEFIAYEFYTKPMSNPLVILKRSGLPEGTKVSTMVAEVRRRWKNAWEGASSKTYERITKAFMDNLIAMGYPEEWRQEILRKALVGYMRVLRRAQNGETMRNRMGTMTSMSRRYKKLCGQTDW